ncbi:MAG: carbohydrate kinase family protein [Prochlorococcaceae cyanobacterium]|jgi:fructokinase
MAASPRVLCFGEALVDRLGPPGGDPVEPSAVCDDRLGGAPANVACALARLGTPVAFLGRLGRDGIGEAFARLFRDRGVQDAAVQWDDLRPSRVVLVRRDPTGERSFGGFAGDRGEGFADQALEAAALAPVLEKLLAPPPGWLLVGTLPLASASSTKALGLALQRAAAHSWRLAVDVNWRPTFWGEPPEAGPPPAARRAMQPLLEQAALLKLAAEEAEWLFGSRDPAAIAAALPQAPAVVVTDGAAPLRWAAGGRGGQLTPPAMPLVDSTGAGDAFLAGLLHRLCREPLLLEPSSPPRALRQAMRFASFCGALVCGGAGAIDPQPTAAAVEDALRLSPEEEKTGGSAAPAGPPPAAPDPAG